MSLFLKRSKMNILFVTVCLMLLIYFVVFLPPRQPSLHWGAKNGSSCPVRTPSQPYAPSNQSHLVWRGVQTRNRAPERTNKPLFETPQALPKIQFAFPNPESNTKSQRDRRDAVKTTFLRCWNAYRTKAWMKDELRPISGNSNNRYGGWGATLVDTLDTLSIMGLQDEFQEAVDAAVTINYSNPDLLSNELPNVGRISVFETNIRFVGGFLAAYELDGCHDRRLLDQAIEIADMLLISFDTPSRMPINTWDPRRGLKGEQQAADSDDNILANLGSLTMEYTRLSQLTGDIRYFNAVQAITDLLDSQQNKTKLPGMWPQRYDVQKNDFMQGNSFPLGAEADSAYEYLLKMYILMGGTPAAAQYEKMYKSATDTAIRHSFFRPMTPTNDDVLLSGKVIVKEDNEIEILSESEHLSCFLGGMFGIGSRIFPNSTHFSVAEKLTKGCIWGYHASPSGILAENINTVPCPTSSTTDCKWNQTLYDASSPFGNYPLPFTGAIDSKYHLRPEALESIFILYRLTGDHYYQDIAWSIFGNIEEKTKTEWGNAGLRDVLAKEPAREDEMESFWLAETLKYLYLIFERTDLVSLDEWVLSTEAHPFRIWR